MKRNTAQIEAEMRRRLAHHVARLREKRGLTHEQRARGLGIPMDTPRGGA